MATINSRAVIGPGFTLLASKQGSVASPLGTISGTTGALFSANHQVTIPARAIIANSYLLVNVLASRTGANATANLRVYLGTAGSTSDSVLGQQGWAATDGQKAWLMGMGCFGTATSSFISTGALTPQGTSTTATYADQSTNVDTTATMTLSIGISNGNASDSFSLHSWSAILYRP
jgi:hypothetical protein